MEDGLEDAGSLLSPLEDSGLEERLAEQMRSLPNHHQAGPKIVTFFGIRIVQHLISILCVEEVRYTKMDPSKNQSWAHRSLKSLNHSSLLSEP